MVFIVILLLAFLAQTFLPWWAIIVLSFATCGIIGKTSKISFWQPFLAIIVLWAGMALYKSFPNNHLLAGRVAIMFGIKVWPAILAVTRINWRFGRWHQWTLRLSFQKSDTSRKSKELIIKNFVFLPCEQQHRAFFLY